MVGGFIVPLGIAFDIDFPLVHSYPNKRQVAHPNISHIAYLKFTFVTIKVLVSLSLGIGEWNLSLLYCSLASIRNFRVLRKGPLLSKALLVVH